MKPSILLLFVFSVVSLSAQDIIQWRGVDRTGMYQETGLLKSWPAEGPELMWHYDQLGEGHSSVAISAGKVYITGLVDGKGYLHVFDKQGTLLNKVMYGDEWNVNYVGSRGTPTIHNGKIYLISGAGDLVCFQEDNLKVLWEKNIFKAYNSENIRWGYNESPLIVDEKLIFTPGGKEHNVVAIHKDTGELLWSCPGEGDLSAYCSPLYIGDQQVPLIVTMTAEHIIGIEAATGKMLWSYPNKNENSIHANIPVYGNNMVLCTSVDKGSTMLRLTNGGRNIELAWEEIALDNMMGGMVKLGDYVYGSGSGFKSRTWFCADWNTGKIIYQEKGLAMGATVYADGMLYCYTDKGEMALVKASPEKFEVVSRFPIKMGTEQHWAHPVVHQGMLYVRHGDTLMAYRVK